MRRNTLSFDPNVTYTVALKYQTGRELDNGRIMFTTTEDEVFFLDSADAHKLHALGLKQYEPLQIKKVVTGVGKSRETGFLVRRAEEVEGPKQQQPGNPAPAAAAHATSAPVPPPHSHSTTAPEPSRSSNTYTSILASSYIAAIDALLIAKDYANEKGVPLTIEPIRITAEDVRASANSIFIEYHKAQERKLRYPQPQNGGANTWQRQ
jgi:hypothetical protein